MSGRLPEAIEALTGIRTIWYRATVIREMTFGPAFPPIKPGVKGWHSGQTFVPENEPKHGAISCSAAQLEIDKNEYHVQSYVLPEHYWKQHEEERSDDY